MQHNDSTQFTTVIQTTIKMADELASVAPEVEALISDSDDDLPVGWEMRTTDDGKVYYIE